MSNKIVFTYEYWDFEELRNKIKECEGSHTQQVVWSTFHDCLTQIDWTDRVIRSNFKISLREDKLIKKPVKISFTTKDGKKVYLKASKITQKPEKISFIRKSSTKRRKEKNERV